MMASIGERMDRGIVEFMSDASHVKSRAREYRLTFIATGDAAGPCVAMTPAP